jgi:chemotaxis protein CheZ
MPTSTMAMTVAWRAPGELGAAVESMESATQKILSLGRGRRRLRRALASALNDDYHHGLAQDVQDHVVRIYEACNFRISRASASAR